MELIGDYGMKIIYHEGKANEVADALSRKSMHSLCTTMSLMKLKDEMAKMGIHMIRKGDVIDDLTIEPEIYDGIKRKRLKKLIMMEAHCTPCLVHPGGDKLYKDLKKTFWWPDMKEEVAEFVTRCLTWQRVKWNNGDHKELMGTTLKMSTVFHPTIDGQNERTIKTLEDMLRACAMEFGESWEDRIDLIEFSYNSGYHTRIGIALFETLYGRKCRSPVYWDDSAEDEVLGPQMLQDMVEQYVSDPSHVLEVENIKLYEALTYTEVPKEILDRNVRKIRNGETMLLKVLWSNHNV
ncbi:uncharacterized protein LOC141602133 [Silene latifolia]|uniref:uncharacterized protein LOC141602133 n=1 Tax=Silene latifolia TaxID=37657 RepID=UPI003D7730D8